MSESLERRSFYRWIVFLQNSQVEAIGLNVTISGDRPYKEPYRKRKRFFCLSSQSVCLSPSLHTMRGSSKKAAICKPGKTENKTTLPRNWTSYILTLDFLSSITKSKYTSVASATQSVGSESPHRWGRQGCERALEKTSWTWNRWHRVGETGIILVTHTMRLEPWGKKS